MEPFEKTTVYIVGIIALATTLLITGCQAWDRHIADNQLAIDKLAIEHGLCQANRGTGQIYPNYIWVACK